MSRDEFEARVRLGADSGPGYMAQGAISGPIGDSDTLSYRASLSFSDTDGFLDNEYLNTQADPYRDTSARVRFNWHTSDRLSGDFRYSRSEIDTTALYFVINNDFGFTAVNGIRTPVPNDVHVCALRDLAESHEHDRPVLSRQLEPRSARGRHPW